jgi:hypothetical protein
MSEQAPLLSIAETALELHWPPSAWFSAGVAWAA